MFLAQDDPLTGVGGTSITPGLARGKADPQSAFWGPLAVLPTSGTCSLVPKSISHLPLPACSSVLCQFIHGSYFLNEAWNALRVGLIYLLSCDLEYQLEGQKDQALPL